jgi:hypothetical protein
MKEKLLLLLLPALTSGQVLCNVPGNCLGHSLDIDIVSSEEECLEYCHSTEGCEWYSYDASVGFCNVLENCPEVLLLIGIALFHLDLCFV